MFKKIFTIVVPVLAITAAILLFGIKVYNDSYSTFSEDGYVLGLAEGKDANRYYFLKENKYKVNESKGEVVFLNTEDEEITIPNDTFVHYTDGSLATFKKAVVLNLPNVKNSTLQYYNVYEGSVFSKVSDGHQIDYLDQKLAFKDFMIKISEDKYMVVGKGITIKYGEEEKTISDGFIEIEYLDGNIIKITNQELNIQNISKDLSVTMDGVVVDLLNKKIVYDGETKVNLGEITIDSDDNIEIIPDEESNIIEEDESLSVEHFEDQPITAPNVNIGGMQSGVVDTSTKRPDEVVEENETVPDAEFDVTAISVTTSSVNVNIQIKDEANVLNGDLTWKVVENATNNIICMGSQAHGQTKLVFSCPKLAPETNYSAIVRSAYTKNEVNYEKDFVQKTFVTKSIGMTIEKDYVKTNEIAFNVEMNGFSTITSFNYDLIGPEGVLISDVNFNLEDNGYPTATTGTDVVVPLVFNTNEYYKIRSNSTYQLKIHDIVYANEVLSDVYGVTKTIKTLKVTPTFSQSTVAVNKQSSKFLLYLNNVNDPDNGAVGYRADIYDIAHMDSKSDIVTSRTATTSSSITVDVDGTIIQRNVNYRAKMYLLFYDNEMEYEIYLGTQDMIMNSVKGAAITFNPSQITHEAIRGSLVINDEHETLDLSKDLNIIYQNTSIGSSAVTIDYKVNLTTLPNRKQFTIAIDNNNLKSNSSYLYILMGWIDYQDGNGSVYSEIGTFWVTTKEPTKLEGFVQDLTGDDKYKDSEAFAISFQLRVTDATTQGNNPNEVNTMEKISFRISSEDYDPSTECVATNRCWEKILTDSDTEDYSSTLKGQLFENEKIFLASDFNIATADLTYGLYKFEVLGATDYTDYENDLPIIEGKVDFNPNASQDSMITSKVFTETVIYNNGAIVKDKDENLNTDTIIGYRISPDLKLPSNDRSTYNIKYTIHNLTNGTSKVLDESEIVKLYTESSNDGNNAVALLFNNVADEGNFKYERGNAYKISMEVTSTVDGSTKTAIKERVLATQPVKQTPKVEAYLSSTGNGIQYWKYYVNDVDNALTVDETAGISAKYKSSVGTTWSQIICSDGTSIKNCLNSAEGTFITKLSSGAIIIKTQAKLLKGASDSSYGIIDTDLEISFIEEIIISSPVEILDSTTYTIQTGSTGNDIKLVLSNYTVSYLVSNVVHAKITFEATDGTTAIIYKEIDDVNNITATGAQISVDFSEIPSMMGKGNISAKVELIYDRNLPGYDTDGNEQGYAIEELLNGTSSHQKYNSKYKIYPSISFDYSTGKLTYTTIEGTTGTKDLSKSTKGMYYANASGYNAYVNIKKLATKNVSCSGTCTFAFTSIRPALYLDDEDLTPIIAGVRGQANLAVDSSLSNMVIIARYYKMNEAGECSGTFVAETYNYSDLGNVFNIAKTDLELGQGYCLNFTYKQSETATLEEEFFYGATYHNANPTATTRYYKFTTLAKPTVTDFKISYDTGTIKSNNSKFDTAAENQKQHDNYNRSMTVSFGVDTLENYDGFTFNVKNLDGTVVSNVTIPGIEITDSTSTFTFTFAIDANTDFQTIAANQHYIFSIEAYKKCTAVSGLCEVGDVQEGKKYLEATENEFTFYIVKPTVKIQRVDEATDEAGEFSIKVTVSDKYRAVGGYSRYNAVNAVYSVTVVNDMGAVYDAGTITTANYWATKKFTGISHCSNSDTCTVYVNYEADLTNTGAKLTFTEQKSITVGASADIGISNIISTSTSGVKIAFIESYMITSIEKIDYTISNTVTGISSDYTNVTALWHQDADETYYYLDLNIPLSSGTYTLDINFKDANGKLVANKSYDVIIY